MLYSDFSSFTKTYKSKFRQISYATKGELTAEDVESEAWLMTDELAKKYGLDIDLTNTVHVDLIFSHLYQKLVNFTEKQIRMAVRLDAWDYGDDPQHDSHPLLNKLASDADDPLAALERKEAAQKEFAISAHHSRAAAYLKLLEHFNNNVSQLAGYLLISSSWCYRCYNRARHSVERQQQLPVTLNTDFMPQTWRKFQLFHHAPPQQLCFNFELQWGY